MLSAPTNDRYVLFSVEGMDSTWLARRNEKVRQRDPHELAHTLYRQMLEEVDIGAGEVDYVATTGEGVTPALLAHK